MCGPRSLAFLSYVAVALYPVISKPVLTRLGQLEGTAAVYVVSTVGLLVLLGASSSLRAELRALPRRLCLRTALLLLLALAANSVGAISFYRGLALSNAPAEYGIFGRLEAIMLVLSGIVLLREKLSIVKAAGVSVAFLASICLITTWDVSHQALFYGSVYVIGMTVGGVIVKQLLDQKVASPVALLMLRTWTVAASAVGVVLVNGALFHVVRNGIQFTDVLVATATGVTMLVIIGFRYQALTRIQLWEFSAMAPVSAVVSTILLRIGGAELGAGPALAMILIGVGEALVHSRSLLRSRAEAEVM